MIYDLYGFKWDLKPGRYIDDKIIDGTFEIETLRYVLKNILRPGDVFIDVGANIGYYTLFGARAVGETGKVYAFEPERTAFNRMVNHVIANGLRQVEVIPRALLEYTCNTLLSVKDDWGECMSSTAYCPSQDFHMVEAQALDSFMFNHVKRQVRLVKIDVEGAELAVLKGASSSLSLGKIDYLMVELTELEGLPNKFKAIVDLLSSRGYYAIDPQVLESILNGTLSMKGKICNMFFKRAGVE